MISHDLQLSSFQPSLNTETTEFHKVHVRCTHVLPSRLVLVPMFLLFLELVFSKNDKNKKKLIKLISSATKQPQNKVS